MYIQVDLDYGLIIFIVHPYYIFHCVSSDSQLGKPNLNLKFFRRHGGRISLRKPYSCESVTKF